jgi:multidrug efflux pump
MPGPQNDFPVVSLSPHAAATTAPRAKNAEILLGIIALAGMIMRNSVILVDQIEQDEKAGLDTWNAIVESTVRRFRPIMLTAAAAILAMIPLSRNDFFGPQAIAIMGGLTVATVLTVFFLPALYAAWFRVERVDANAASSTFLKDSENFDKGVSHD